MLPLVALAAQSQQAPKRPNVLFISMDDLNDWIGCMGGHPQTITPFTVRNERGIAVDEMASLYHVRSDAPPLLLITGDRELEMLGRYEENAYLMRMMKVVGHKETQLHELQGYGHNMTQPAFPLLINEVQRVINTENANGKID